MKSMTENKMSEASRILEMYILSQMRDITEEGVIMQAGLGRNE